MFGDKADPLEDSVRFLRITCLGSSGCGKTSLISSFVNSICPLRCPPTEVANIFYRKIDLFDDDGDVGAEKAKSVFLEIEDTPGSERGHNTVVAAQDADPMQIRKGSRVTVTKDKKDFNAAFHRYKAKKGKSLKYEKGMDAMLGADFTVKSVGDGTFGLSAQDGGDIWEFPAEALRLKLGISLPIDPFLDFGDKPQEVIPKLQDRKILVAAQQRPLSSYGRPVGPSSMDKSVTKNRMGFLICFDVSDEDMFSLKEAMNVFRMLEKRLVEQRDERRSVMKVVPIVWFVACKVDKTSSPTTVKKNLQTARRFTEDEDIKLIETSARRHQGTKDVFYEMARLIEAKMPLWRYIDTDYEYEGDEEEEGNCSLQ